MYCIIRVKSNPYIFLSQILNSALWDLNLARLDISKNSYLVPLIIIRSFPKKQQNMSQSWGHSRGTSFIIYLSILGTYICMHCKRCSKTIVKRLTTSVYCYRKDSVILEILASSVLTMCKGSWCWSFICLNNHYSCIIFCMHRYLLTKVYYDIITTDVSILTYM